MIRVPLEVRERAEAAGEEVLSVILELADRDRSFEGGGAERTLREAIAALAMFRAGELDDAALAEVARARTLVQSALGMIADAPARECMTEVGEFLEKLRARAIELMVQSQRPASDRGVAPPAPDFILGLGTPALLRGITVAVPRLLARDDADLGEAPIERGAKSRGGTEGERRQIEALARDGAEDLASFFTLRLTADNAPWKDADRFERRLLANIDGLVALARPARRSAATLDLAEALFGYATEWAVPDRGRTFAFAFTLSCIDSDAALLWVTMAMRRAAERTLPAYVDALALGSNPSIDRAIVGLLSSDMPRDLMLVALRAAIRRRVFNAGTMLGLSDHPDGEVAALATRCLAFAPAAVAQAALSERTSSQNPMVRAVAGATLNELGVATGRQVLRDLVDEIVGRQQVHDSAANRSAVRTAARALAVNGDPKDADRVWVSSHALRDYRAVGYLGHVAHVPLLFSTMDDLDGDAECPDQDRWDLLDVAAGAIRRITGITPPRHGPGRYDFPEFKAIWAAQGPPILALATREGRLRFGKAFDKSQVVEELAAPSSRQADRRLLAAEVALHSRGELRFDVDGWTASQKVYLKMIQEAWAR